VNLKVRAPIDKHQLWRKKVAKVAFVALGRVHVAVGAVIAVIAVAVGPVIAMIAVGAVGAVSAVIVAAVICRVPARWRCDEGRKLLRLRRKGRKLLSKCRCLLLLHG
jgi:hypothetical protein